MPLRKPGPRLSWPRSGRARRSSFYLYNTIEEVDLAADALARTRLVSLERATRILATAPERRAGCVRGECAWCT
jgi:hypothetical protein